MQGTKPLLTTRSRSVVASVSKNSWKVCSRNDSTVAVGGTASCSPWRRLAHRNTALPCYQAQAACARRSSSRLSCTRYTSSRPTRETNPPPSARSNLEFQVRELERDSRTRRLSKHDLQTRMWPLLNECASLSSFTHNERAERHSSKSTQQECLDRAKLSNRLLELCLKEVEARRVFLWEWLHNLENKPGKTCGVDGKAPNFSPTAYWDDVPHPTKEMYSIVISAWKGVIESCSSFSARSMDALDLMESSAQQSSSILSLMEDEHSSDVEFVETYNSLVTHTGRSALLVSGAAYPDLRNYSEVIRTWGTCIDGSALRLMEKHESASGGQHGRGAFQKRLRLEASAMKSMMKLLERMEADQYEALSITDNSYAGKTWKKQLRPSPDRICYNIVLASMARRVNPSLYEMRLVLQRMMERVKAEVEYLNNETELDQEEYDEQFEAAMAFFPDVYSYNALIEARANCSATFASDSTSSTQQPRNQFASPRQHVWQKGKSEHLLQGKADFSSSEEEAILAERILGEMSSIVTVSVRPNIWSYNCEFREAFLKALLVSVASLTKFVNPHNLSCDKSVAEDRQ